MACSPILDPSESYTFRKCAELPFDTANILGEFGVSLQNICLDFPLYLPIDPTLLNTELQGNLLPIAPTSEIAHWQALLFPFLKEDLCNLPLNPSLWTVDRLVYLRPPRHSDYWRYLEVWSVATRMELL
jgi:hypothetical protein